MYFLYNLIALVFAVGFFILLFLVAWYIAVPLLIIAFFIWVFQQIALSLRHKPHLTLKRKKTRPHQTEKIIDVEWTEV